MLKYIEIRNSNIGHFPRRVIVGGEFLQDKMFAPVDIFVLLPTYLYVLGQRANGDRYQ